MEQVFFEATRNALNAITELCDLMHPITVSVWNTQAQVNGICNMVPAANEKQLASKFGLGSGIHGVNYKRFFLQKSWEEHKEDIAWLFLNSAIPIYEGWLEELHTNVFSDTNGNLNVKAMQFPASCSKNILNEIARLTSIESNILKNEFYSIYSTKKYCCYSKLDNLVIAYRYFKEMRNCYMHNNKIANSNLITAYTNFSALSSPTDLNMTEIPEHVPPILDSKISISLRGVIGFTQILIQLMVTIDAELLRSQYAEVALIATLQKLYPSPISIGSDRVKAIRQIRGIFEHGKYIRPSINNLADISRFLIDNHIIQPITLV